MRRIDCSHMSHYAKGAFVLVRRQHRFGGDQVARIVGIRGRAFSVQKFLTRGMRWTKPMWIVESDIDGIPDEDDHRLALAKASLA